MCAYVCVQGGNDCLNAENLPVGQWVSRSWGGWTIVGAAAGAEAKPGTKTNLSSVAASLTAQGGSKSHAVLVGVSGEAQARLAIETSGELYARPSQQSHTHTHTHHICTLLPLCAV